MPTVKAKRKPSLTTEQKLFLMAVMHTQGRLWKAALRKAWSSGRYTNLVSAFGKAASNAEATLQGLRNTLGPSGLTKLTKKDLDMVYWKQGKVLGG